MAKGEVYRKFNNIFDKITVENLIEGPVSAEFKKTKDYQDLQKTVLKSNLAYGVDSLTHNELEGIKYTLGYEIETVMGRVSMEDASPLNLKAVHDGSLRDEDGGDPTGGEYVTGVLYGDSGFKQLYDICRVLNRNCDIDHRAGVHVHIGSLKWSKEDVVLAYLLAEIVEEDMFSILPESRSRNRYCRKLEPVVRTHKLYQDLVQYHNDPLQYEPIIDIIYNDIFKVVSGGELPSRSVNSNTNHPRGSKCGYDLSAQRYCWMNFVTLIFNTKGNIKAKTLEIRSHSATMNYSKIKNWAKIWVAFCHTVSNNKTAILNKKITVKGVTYPLNLFSVCLAAYPKTGKKLVSYMEERKKLFSKNDESVEWVSTEENNKTLKQILEIN